MDLVLVVAPGMAARLRSSSVIEYADVVESPYLPPDWPPDRALVINRAALGQAEEAAEEAYDRVMGGGW